MKFFDADKFAAMLETRSAGYSLREAAEQSGVSASTLSRVLSQKGRPDLETFFGLCLWMDVSPRAFLVGALSSDSTAEAEAARLRAALQQIRDITDIA